MLKYKSALLYVTSILVVWGLAPKAYSAPNLLLWDGEEQYSYNYGEPNETESFRGRACFKGMPDAYHRPRITLPARTFRCNISGYDEIWLFIKCTQLNRSAAFTVSTWYGTSNEVNINSCIDGEAMDTTYRLARIPISQLKTATYLLDCVDCLYFGLASPTVGHYLYIDEIWAIDFDNGNAEQMALVDTLPPVSFGEVNLGESLLKSFPLKNVGLAPLAITGYTITDSPDFAAVTGPSLLQPGESGTVTVRYSPSVPNAGAGSLQIQHNLTALGETTKVLLNGAGIGPALQLSNIALNFGTQQLGGSTAWPVAVSNSGNRDLNIFSITGSPGVFTVEPASFAVPAGTAVTFLAKFTPTATGTMNGNLTVASNDPLHPVVQIETSGACVSPGTSAVLNAVITEVTSSQVSFVWPFVSAAEKYRVYFGPDPAATPNGSLQNGVLWKEFEPTVNSCTLRPLAAAIDVFIRIEAVGASGLISYANLHARTIGGPRAPLERGPDANYVREVHFFSPRILQVVLANYQVQSYSGTSGSLVNYAGPQWQAGSWAVKKYDGATVPVTAVYRHSVPVAQPYYEIGQNAQDQYNLLDVDHRMFLVLDSAIPSGTVLYVQGPTGAFYLPFSDNYLETPIIQVNQVGYSPRATERWAYISGWLGDGGPLVLNEFPASASMLAEPADPLEPRTAVASNLPITVRAQFDSDAGCEVRQIDLASVPPAEGSVYRVRVPGVGVSWPTQVSETAVFKAFYVAIRGLYHNRWGRELRPDCTEWGPRPADHPLVFTGELAFADGTPAFGYGPTGMFPKETPQVGARPMRGGHHNAGDFDIQLSDHMIGMMLLRLFEVNGEAFTDGQLTIPESGNGIPDVLDEALWNVAAWEQLQEEDGGVRGGVESYVEPNIRAFADEDPLPYWTYSRHPLFSMNMAGIFAQASRLVEPFNPAKAAELRDRAIRAYNYAYNNGIRETRRGCTFFGAGELFRLTGEQAYLDLFTAAWVREYDGAGPNIRTTLPAWTEFKLTEPQTIIGDNVAGYALAPGALPTHVQRLTNIFTARANDVVNETATLHAHRNARSYGPGWGYGSAVGEFAMRILYRMQLGNLNEADWQRYFNALSLSADYSLGCNPDGRVWLTGLGSRHPEEPLHADSLCFLKQGKDAVPGLAVFGPTTNLVEKSYYDYGEYCYYPTFQNHPLMRRYTDIRTFVLQNEVGTQQIAIHAQLLGMLVTPGLMPAESWLPGGPEHRNPLAPREALTPGTGGDRTPPLAGTIRAPAVATTSPIFIQYSDATDLQSGLKLVRLWRKMGAAGTWQDTGLKSTTTAGVFAFVPTGDAVYYFALQAEDNAGNVNAAPSGNGSASTAYDTTPPVPGILSTSPYARTSPIAVTYTGAGDAVSGLKEVRLWAKKDRVGTWTNTGLKNTQSSGSFAYPVSEEASYYFYLQAVDNAGCKNPNPTDELVGVQ